MTLPAASAHHFTLRYVEGTDLRDRKHVHTLVRASTWLEAEEARLALPEEIADRFEVVERGELVPA